MERLKRLARRVFCLPPLPTLLIAVPSLVLVFALMALDITTGVAYVAYLLSAYGLILLVTGMPALGRAARAWWGRRRESSPLLRRLDATPFGRRYLSDPLFRAEVALYVGAAMNLAYIVIKLAAGIRYHSAWFVALAAYYTLLAVMRYVLLRYVGRQGVKADLTQEWRRYRLCGIVLLVMNQALAAMVVLIVTQNHGYQYPGLLIYAMAAYAFYYIITAVRGLVVFRRHGSPVLMAAKLISVVAAMVAMLSLETAMLAQFGGEDWAFRQIMTSATGGVICSLVLAMAVFMIVHATKKLRHPAA